MNLARTAAITLRHFYLIRGSLPRLLPMFVWIAVDIILWGFITRYLNNVASPGFDFVPMFLGAVLLWDFLSRIMTGVTTAFFEDVWSRNFLNIFASPLTISEYVCGLVLSSIATSSFGLVIMLLLASGVFGLSLLSYGLLLVPFFMVLFLFGIALGIFGCGVVMRYGPAAEWLIWPIPAMLSPLAGVFYPLSTLPAWMQYLARLLPPSYVFENMRRIVAGGAASWSELAWAMCLAAASILLAGWYFIRVYRHAVRTGLIARYSAETIG